MVRGGVDAPVGDQALAGAHRAECGDLDNDGYLDVVTLSYSSLGYQINVWHNAHDGTLTDVTGSTMPAPQTQRGQESVFIADLDGDGWKDLLTAGPFCGTSQLFMNQGGTFTEVVDSLPSSGCQKDFPVDLDRDGRFEIVRRGHANSSTLILRHP